MSPPSPPVLIVGAGLIALALAQSLLRHKIPFRIFERDPHPFARPQGYRIRLSLLGLDALRSLLPSDVFETIRAEAAEWVPGVKRFGLNGEQMIGPPPGGGSDSRKPDIDLDSNLVIKAMSSVMPVDRTLLRKALLNGLEDKVEWGKSLKKYDEGNDKVIAYFEDGSTAEGIILVGADGAYSRVAAQAYGGDSAREDLGQRMLYGLSPLTPRLAARMPETLQQGICVAMGPLESKDVKSMGSLFIKTCRFPGSDSEDYVFWVLSDSAGFRGHLDSDDTVLALKGKEAANFAVIYANGANLSPELLAVLEHQDIDLTTSWPMLTSRMSSAKSDSWRVMLVGDSLNVMPPTGGLGGNTGFHCAAILSESIQAASSAGDWQRLMKAYQERSKAEAAIMVTLATEAAVGRWPLAKWEPLMRGDRPD